MSLSTLLELAGMALVALGVHVLAGTGAAAIVGGAELIVCAVAADGVRLRRPKRSPKARQETLTNAALDRR